MQVIFIRHGNTNKPVDKATGDLARTLTEKGVAQAKALGETLRTMGRPDKVFSSIAPRAVATAKLALGPGVHVIEVPELYMPLPPEDKAALDADFSRLGYAPLREYMKGNDSWGAYVRYGQAAKAAIVAQLTGDEEVVMIFGHAVLLQVVAQAFYMPSAEELISGKVSVITDEERALLDLELGECETFTIEIKI